MELKDQIRIAREAAGLTQQQLADKVGKSRQSVIWWETGEHVPRLPMLQRMETLLKTRFNATGSKALGKVDFGNIKPEYVRLALSISRLPKASREAVVTLVTTLEEFVVRG